MGMQIDRNRAFSVAKRAIRTGVVGAVSGGKSWTEFFQAHTLAIFISSTRMAFL
jgi:hypothetical protein